jgi:hypothetical protein
MSPQEWQQLESFLAHLGPEEKEALVARLLSQSMAQAMPGQETDWEQVLAVRRGFLARIDTRPEPDCPPESSGADHDQVLYGEWP